MLNLDFGAKIRMVRSVALLYIPSLRLKNLISIFKHILGSQGPRIRHIGLFVLEISYNFPTMGHFFDKTVINMCPTVGLHIFSLKNLITLLTMYEKVGRENLIYDGPHLFPWKCVYLTDIVYSWFDLQYLLSVVRQPSVRKKM